MYIYIYLCVRAHTRSPTVVKCPCQHVSPILFLETVLRLAAESEL